MPHNGSKSVDSLIDQYKKIRPYYEEFCIRLKVLLKDLLSKASIKYHVVEERTKSLESFSEKLQRDGKTYKDPLQEMTDLAGLRVIVYYEDDVDRVCRLLETEFKIDSRSSDKKTLLEPDRFGYLSIHKIISLSDARAKLPEWSDFSGFLAEIQVRTVLQHAWAAISHALQYKNRKDIPYQFRRKLLRLSGLLELADEEFLDLRRKQEIVRKEISARIEKRDLNLPINVISLREFMATSATAKEILRLIKRTTLSIWPESEIGTSQLLAVCNLTGIRKMSELEERLRTLKPKAESFFEKFEALEVRPSQEVSGSQGHWLAVLVFAGSDKKLTKLQTMSTLWSDSYTKSALEAGKIFA